MPALFRGYRTPAQAEVRHLTPDEADALAPQLAEGSMRPKVESCAAFARAGGEALITSAEQLQRALDGESGTRIGHE